MPASSGTWISPSGTPEWGRPVRAASPDVRAAGGGAMKRRENTERPGALPA